MGVPALLWLATAGILLVLVAWDLAESRRMRPVPSPGSDALAVGGYLLLAVLFGLALLTADGARLAGEFYAGWGSSLAVTVDSLVVLLLITSGFPDPRRVVALGVAVAVLTRCGLLAFGIPAPPVFTWVSALFGAGVLAAGWLAFRHNDSATLPTASRRPGLVHGAAVSAAAVFALFSVSGTAAVTGQAYLVLCANMFALLGFHRLFRLLVGLVERIPDASVGLAVVLVFIGAKSVLAGVTGTAHDWRVIALELSMISAVAVLSAITAARIPSR